MSITGASFAGSEAGAQNDAAKFIEPYMTDVKSSTYWVPPVPGRPAPPSLFFSRNAFMV